MAEIYENWLSSKMTRDEFNELTDEEKKERKRLQKRNNNKKYYQENREEMLETNRKYKETNKEKQKEYSKKYKQTPIGKKLHTLADWKYRNLQETQEELDRIHELYLHQELCNACDIKLTRNGDNHPTQACMDHDHITHRFRHVICRSCNNNDKWKKYFC